MECNTSSLKKNERHKIKMKGAVLKGWFVACEIQGTPFICAEIFRGETPVLTQPCIVTVLLQFREILVL